MPRGAADLVQGWSRVGTLLPIIGHRSNSTSVNDPSSDGGSLRASFTQQTQRPTPPATPERYALVFTGHLGYAARVCLGKAARLEEGDSLQHAVGMA